MDGRKAKRPFSIRDSYKRERWLAIIFVIGSSQVSRGLLKNCHAFRLHDCLVGELCIKKIIYNLCLLHSASINAILELIMYSCFKGIYTHVRILMYFIGFKWCFFSTV